LQEMGFGAEVPLVHKPLSRQIFAPNPQFRQPLPTAAS
jgi:hypothetical protein